MPITSRKKIARSLSGGATQTRKRYRQIVVSRGTFFQHLVYRVYDHSPYTAAGRDRRSASTASPGKNFRHITQVIDQAGSGAQRQSRQRRNRSERDPARCDQQTKRRRQGQAARE